MSNKLSSSVFAFGSGTRAKAKNVLPGKGKYKGKLAYYDAWNHLWFLHKLLASQKPLGHDTSTTVESNIWLNLYSMYMHMCTQQTKRHSFEQLRS